MRALRIQTRSPVLKRCSPPSLSDAAGACRCMGIVKSCLSKGKMSQFEPYEKKMQVHAHTLRTERRSSLLL